MLQNVFKDKTGSEIIASSIESFTKVVSELETGIELCAKEEDSINEEIQKLNDDLSKTQDSKTQAQSIKTNIEKMLGIN